MIWNAGNLFGHWAEAKEGMNAESRRSADYVGVKCVLISFPQLMNSFHVKTNIHNINITNMPRLSPSLYHASFVG
jgi:hypothetical protein